MADILQEFPIRASRDVVYSAVSEPDGLDRWWTETSAGRPVAGTGLHDDQDHRGTTPRSWRATTSPTRRRTTSTRARSTRAPSGSSSRAAASSR